MAFNSPIDEHELDALTLDEWLIDDPDATYMMKVSSHALTSTHINKGDFVLLLRTANFRVGDLVLAGQGDEWRLRYLCEQSGMRYVHTDPDGDPDTSDMVSCDEFPIQLEAKAISIIRKL